MIRFISFFILALLFLPMAVAAQPEWFVSTPGGSSPQAKEALSLKAPSLSQELEHFSRSDVEPFPVDLRRYQLLGQSGPVSLNVGLQSLPQEGLIVNGDERQGFSLNLRGGPRNTAIAGFILQTENESIEGDALGLSNEDNRLGGIAGEISPWSQGPVRLRLQGGYLAGTRPGLLTPQKGDAWSMAAEAVVGSNLFLRGEFSGSRYENGRPRGDEQQGRAAVFLARYRSILHPERANPVAWHIGVENSYVDPGFHSLGNAYIVSDRDRVRLFGGVRRDRLRIAGHVDRGRNNLDDLRHRPTIESSDYSLAFHVDRHSPLVWMGIPRHTLIFEGFSRRPNEADESRYGATDDERAGFRYRIDFSRRTWEWGAGYHISRYEDHAAPWRNAEEQSIDLRVEARIAERLFLAPFAEFGISERQGGDFRTRRYGLSGSVVLIPDRLRGGWNAHLSARELAAAQWERDASVSAEIACTLRPPGRDRPGLLLVFNGHLKGWEDDYFPAAREYRFFLNLRSTLGLSLQGQSRRVNPSARAAATASRNSARVGRRSRGGYSSAR